MKRRKERLHTYVVKSEKVAPDVLETSWIGSSKYEVSFLYGYKHLMYLYYCMSVCICGLTLEM